MITDLPGAASTIQTMMDSFMKTSVSNARTGDSHEHAPDMDLLQNPLEFLEKDHLRTRTTCATFDRIADSEAPARADIFDALSYLENEPPLGIVDENADLARLMRRHLGDEPTSSEQTCLRDLATTLRTDMALENARRLPLAKRLLPEEEISELRSAMFQRRLSDFGDHRAPGV